MQKKNLWKMILCLLFVSVAGIFYFRMTDEEAGELYKENGTIFHDTKESGTESGKESGAGNGKENSTGSAKEGSAGSGKESDAKVPDGADSFGNDLKGQEEDGNAKSLLYIHVCGSVRNPGVYRLSENSRVVEAIEAAGGFLPTAADDYLNQAELLRDGQKVYVPNKEEAEELKKSGQGFVTQSGQGVETRSGQEALTEPKPSLVNINTATIAQLMELNGIGKSKAEAIIAYREKNGGFQTCEDVMKVPGIKEAAYQKICDQITVGK